MILLRELVKTDFKLRYQGSLLGHVWSVVKPLALFFVMYMVFVRFLKFGAGIPHFAISLLLAITIWQFFSEAVGQGMNSVVARGDLLRKINFPKVIVVISATVNALINLSINLGVVLVFAVINGVDFHWHILLAPLLLIELYVFALALALLLSALYVRFRDIQHIWDVIMQAWFYATPIIYPITMVAAVSVTASKILILTPIAQIIQDMRYLVVYDGTDTAWNYIADPFAPFIPLLIVIILLIIGIRYFARQSQKFAEET